MKSARLSRLAFKGLIAALLAAILAVLVWDSERITRVLPSRATPHEAYVDGLEAAGLADAALGRDWIAASVRALEQPAPSTLPLETTVRHTASEPRAYGYSVDLKRGRLLRIDLALAGPEAAQVFIDVFQEVGGGAAPRHVASAEHGGARLEHEVRRDGTYIIRIQPELLRGGDLRIEQRTTASLTFPVSGRDVRAVRSFFGDPREAGRRAHHGLDIFAPQGTPVVAATDGLVTSVGTNRLGGNVVWLWDPARRQSQYYAHLARQSVQIGERVRAGDEVGRVGNTGNARTTPPHLHFGIYSFGEGPVDPLPFVSGATGPQPSSAEAATNPEHATTGSGG